MKRSLSVGAFVLSEEQEERFSRIYRRVRRQRHLRAQMKKHHQMVEKDKCPICMQDLGTTPNPKKKSSCMFSCGHWFCCLCFFQWKNNCIQTAYDNLDPDDFDVDEQEVVTCPVCRQNSEQGYVARTTRYRTADARKAVEFVVSTVETNAWLEQIGNVFGGMKL